MSNQCVAENDVSYKLLGKYFMAQVSRSMLLALSLCHQKEIRHAVVPPLDLLKMKISLRLMMFLSQCEDQSVNHQLHFH